MRGRRAATRGKGLEVEEDGGEGEECGEGVLAFGDPGDGFDTEGMERPEGGSETGKPGTADGGEEDEVEENGVGGVEEDVGQMVAPRRIGGSTEEEIVEEIGNPEERGVHGLVAMEGGESVTEGLPGEPVEDNGVVVDEDGVVQADEPVPDGRGEEGEGDQEEEHRGKEGMDAGFHGGLEHNRENECGAREK